MLGFIYSILTIINLSSANVETSLLGNKVHLSPSSNYHFSDPGLVEVHLEGQTNFFIGIAQGAFDYNVGPVKKRHFILSEKQKIFFDKTKILISQTYLEWEMNNDILIIQGNSASDTLYSYLLNECKKTNSKIKLQITTPNPSLEIHPCLGHLKSKPKVQAHLMLINRARLSDKGFGLGAPSSLPWSLSDEGQLKLQELFGEVKASTSREKSKGEMIFEGLVSLEQPLKFTNGLEVGVQPRSILARGGVEWKNITSHISLDLIDFNERQALIEVDFKKMSRTGEANVFKTESFKRKNQLLLNQWIKLLTYIETTEDNQRRSPLSLFLLGKRSKSLTSQRKELWLKLVDLETL